MNTTEVQYNTDIAKSNIANTIKLSVPSAHSVGHLGHALGIKPETRNGSTRWRGFEIIVKLDKKMA